MSGIDRTSSVKQTRANKDATTAHNASKNPKSTPSKVSAAGYRLRSTPETSSPVLKERRGDASPDSARSTKTPVKKSVLKINKIAKLKSSPYATRSLSPLASVLRNGKRKREALNMIPKFKKRVLVDRDDTKSISDGNEKETEQSLSSSESPLKQSLKRNVPVERSSLEPSKRCKISHDAESKVTLSRVLRRVGKQVVKNKVKDEDQIEASESTDSPSSRLSVKKECDTSPEPKNVERTSTEPSERCKISHEDESKLALSRVTRGVGKHVAKDKVRDEDQSEASESSESLSTRSSVKKVCAESPEPKNVERNSAEPSKRSKRTQDAESKPALVSRVTRRVGKRVAKVKNEDQSEASESSGSLSDRSAVKKECDASPEPKNSDNVCDISLDRTSMDKTLDESCGSALEPENTSGTGDLISKRDCGTTFDLSKCENCLQPVIVDTKDNLDSAAKPLTGSDDCLPEMLYLSDSQNSFEKVSESFSQGTDIPKTELDGRCELDDCNDILNIENSSSSLMVCPTSHNIHSGVSLPPYGPEDETVSVNATCDSLSMLDADESMNEFMHEISSSKGRENTLDFADSSNDSNHIDATSIIKTLEQTERLSDEMDSLCKDQGLEPYIDPTKADGCLEAVPNVAIENVVATMGSSMHHRDMNENMKESSIHLSVYGGVSLSESYSFDSVDHLQDFSASISNCERLTALDIEGSTVFNPNQTPPVSYSMHVSESLGMPPQVTMASEQDGVTHSLNDSLPVTVTESLDAITAMDTKGLSSNHEDQGECNIFTENSSQGAGQETIHTIPIKSLGGTSTPLAESGPLNAHSQLGVEPQEAMLESPFVEQARELENLNGTIPGEDRSGLQEGAEEFVSQNNERSSNSPEDLSHNCDEKGNLLSLNDSDEPKKSSAGQNEEEDFILPIPPSVSDENLSAEESTVLVSDSSKSIPSTPSVPDVDHSCLKNSMMESDSSSPMLPLPSVSDVNHIVVETSVMASNSLKSMSPIPSALGVNHSVVGDSLMVSDTSKPILPPQSDSDVDRSVVDSSVMASNSSKPMSSPPSVSDINHSVVDDSVIVSDSSKPMLSLTSDADANHPVPETSVTASNSFKPMPLVPSVSDVNHPHVDNSRLISDSPRQIDFSSDMGNAQDSNAANSDAVDVSVVDSNSVDISNADTSDVELCDDGIDATDSNDAATTSVAVSTVEKSDWSVSVTGNSVDVIDKVDANDEDENAVLNEECSVIERDASIVSSEVNGTVTAQSKVDVVTSLNACDTSLEVEGKCESVNNVVELEKSVDLSEPVDSPTHIKSDVFEDVVGNSEKSEVEMDALSSAVTQSVDEKVVGPLVPSTSSKSESTKDESVSKPEITIEEDSAEQLAIKETILNALGLQSSRAASMAKSSVRQELPPIPSRTSGTLKTIIKVPKVVDKKRTRNPLRLSLDIQKASQEKELMNAKRQCTSDRPEFSGPLSAGQDAEQDPYTFRIFNEANISSGDTWEAYISKHKSKSHGNSRKFSSGDISHLDHLPFSRTSINGMNASSSLDWQSKSCQDLDHNVPSDGSSNSGRSSQPGSSEGSGASGEPSLVIPEKSASFSIHPERLCHDVCCYCFGKFGSLDTPMHLAQMKGEEKRRTALALEANLQQDSCLCDACYRYLDRKASCPSYQPYRRQSVSGGILTKPQVCCVRGCSLPAHHLVRRKWLTRLRRTISKLLPIELTPVPPHQQQPLHAPLCSRHFYCLEYYSLCGICKRKLSRNNMHPVGREVHALNSVLMEDAIPVTLTGKIFLCKMCRYYSGIRLKYRDKSMLSSGHRTFFDGYRKRIWHYLGIQTLDSSEISEPMEIPKKKKKSRLCEGESSKACEMEKTSVNDGNAPSQTAEIISSESGSEVSCGKPGLGPLPTKIRLKLGNVSIGQLSNVGSGEKESKGELTGTSASHRGKADPSKPKKKSSGGSEVKTQCFPGTEHLGLNASFVFHGNSEKNKEWEKCTTTIQFDSKTKKLWQNLYYPYGNFSSFIRHLVLMEKNWRSGDLILAPNASPQAVNYVNSVQNRIAAYEGNSQSDCARTALPSSSKHASSRPVSSTAAPPRLNTSTSSSFVATSSSSMTPVDLTREPVQLLHIPPLVISSKSASVPQKASKDSVRVLPSPTLAPRFNSQIAPRVQTITPLTAQLIPVSAAAANFLPMTQCGSSQFISFGNTSSFIQLGGPSGGVVHPGASAYHPCVQLNQQVVPTEKVDAGGEGYLNLGKNPSSSLSELELHISNVRSLANDAGSNNAWDPQLDKQLVVDENTYTSDSATQSSGRSEEHSLEVGSVGSGASVSMDNHSDEAVANSSCGRGGQGDIFGIV
ncbi:uncharacterized protein LOC124154430 [Ischnura elegans]|uniref:uncharacterized protein LOC124154430 n=1 Tax=Ischnura elegans TaxID=197161 RepID=UPI001ED88BAA|nr:uncharacterized protein LOC124154430 [Ischnura elegans]XP_046384093.1 uncharacterized protein LOC124154430 [Ischnura elegans]